MTPQEKLEEIKLQHGALQFYKEQGYPADWMEWLIARVEQLEEALKEISKLDPFDKTLLLSNPPQNKQTFAAIQIAQKSISKGPKPE